MKLSIIVPVYNAEKYLHPCLDSLVHQELEDYEVILINDGSRDSSESILLDYQARFPEKVRVRTVENGGQGRAKNIGLSMAKGAYIGFVDSDDYVERSMFRRLLEKAEEEQSDLVTCDFKRVTPDGAEQYECSWQDGKALLAAGQCWNKLFRRELIGSLQHPEGLWYEDFAFSAHCLVKAEKPVHLPEALYYYRCGQTSTMNNKNARKNLDILKVMEELKGFLVENNGREDFAFLLINHVLLDAINRVEKQCGDGKDEVIRSLRAYVRENIPRLFSCGSFRRESRNRRIVMALNYYGLHGLSRKLLELKNGR